MVALTIIYQCSALWQRIIFDRTRPNPTQPMGQPNPWPCLPISRPTNCLHLRFYQIPSPPGLCSWPEPSKSWLNCIDYQRIAASALSHDVLMLQRYYERQPLQHPAKQAKRVLYRHRYHGNVLQCIKITESRWIINSCGRPIIVIAQRSTLMIKHNPSVGSTTAVTVRPSLL